VLGQGKFKSGKISKVLENTLNEAHVNKTDERDVSKYHTYLWFGQICLFPGIQATWCFLYSVWVFIGARPPCG
jgi:hypothetical protein